MKLNSHVELQGYGTSEGVTKEWDTRGRGRKLTDEEDFAIRDDKGQVSQEEKHDRWLKGLDGGRPNIGTRVKVKDSFAGNPKGKTGTVAVHYKGDPSVHVKFDDGSDKVIYPTSLGLVKK